MNNKLSVIIPIYNSEKWLKRCIESVVNQTYKDLEILLIDDGSTDSSSQICDEYEQKDKRVKVIHKKNEGVSKARNDGIKISTGKYIKFIDSDDEIELNCCEKLVQTMNKYSVDEVICGFQIYKNNKLLRTPHLDSKQLRIRENIKNFEYIEKLLASPCNKIYKKELITDLFDDEISAGEDLLFNLNYLLNVKEISTIPDCLYKVHLDNDQSLNRKFREDRLDINLNILDRQLQICKEVYGEEADYNYIYQRYILRLHSYIMNIYDNCTPEKTRQIIKKYLNETRIEKVANNCNFNKKYYRMFNNLVKNKRYKSIYSLMQIRKMILSLLKK